MKYKPSSRYETQFTVSREAIDVNGHVNNVEYVKWMQEIAVEHAGITGGTEATHSIGCTWVAREHRITYLNPCFEGDEIRALTWVEAFGKVRSMRKYQFERLGDGKVVARGETDWVLIDVRSGRPKPITDKIRACFLL